MPVFLAIPLIVAAVVTVAINVAVALVVGAIAQALTPQPGLKSTLSISVSANDPRRLIFGRAATAGQLVTFQTWPDSGSNVNEYICLLIRLCDHEVQGFAPQINITGTLTDGSNKVTGCSTTAGIEVGMPIVSYASGQRFPPGTYVEAILSSSELQMSNEATFNLTGATIVVNCGVYWSGNPVILGDDGAVPQFYADGGDNCWVTLYTGGWNQAANPTMVANSNGRWTSNSRGRGVAYVEIVAKANIKAFPNGIDELLQFVFVLDGIALYDPRQDVSQGGSGDMALGDTTTWALTSNPGVVGYNMLTGIRVEDTSAAVGSRASDTFFGLNLPQSVLPFDENVAAMNACDVPFPLLAGGTQATFACNGVVAPNTGDTFETALGDVLATMGGKLVQSPTRFFFVAAAAQTPARTFTDADFRLDGPYRLTNDIPLDEVCNAVVGQFSDPASMYTAQPLPPRISPTDAASDGGYKYSTMDLSFCTCEAQGQYLQEIARRRQRLGITAQVAVAPENLDLEATDWITWQSDRYGWTLTFEVIQNDGKASADEEEHMMVVLDLAQVDADLFAWTPSTDELSRQAPAFLPSADPIAVPVTTLTVAADTITSPGGAVAAALLVSTDPLTDPTVVAIRFAWQVAGLPAGAAQTFYQDFAVNPATASGTQTYSLANGVVGGYRYNVQAAAVRNPPQDLDWTDWVESATATTVTGASSASTTLETVATSTLALGAAPSTPWYVDVDNTSGGPLAITLPSAPASNQVIVITDVGGNASSHAITIKAGSSVITTIAISNGYATLRWNGSGWFQGV